MKKIMMFLLLASVTATAMADVNTKLRFFETMGNGKRLNCYGDCRYLEMEIKNNFLSIRSCSIDKNEFLLGNDEARAVVSENINSKCKSFLKNFEITDEMGLAFKQKLAEGKVSKRDPVQMLKNGSIATVGAISTVFLGILTVVSIIDPEVPIFILTGPVTVATAGATVAAGHEFVSEFKGKPMIVYGKGTAEAIRETIKKGQIGAFYIHSEGLGFWKTFISTPNNFDSFKSAWQRFARELEMMKYRNSDQTFTSPAADIMIN